MLYLSSTDEAIWPGPDLDCFTHKKRSFAMTYSDRSKCPE